MSRTIGEPTLHFLARFLHRNRKLKCIHSGKRGEDRHMINSLSLLFVVLFLSCVVLAQSVSDTDLKMLEGGTWVRTLV